LAAAAAEYSADSTIDVKKSFLRFFFYFGHVFYVVFLFSKRFFYF